MMIQDGLEKEVESVKEFKDHTALNTVGYKEFFNHYSGEYTKEFAIQKIKQNSRNYAKRQISWLKRDELYSWFDPKEIEKVIQSITDKA